MKNLDIKSPLTGSTNVVLKKEIDCSTIKNLYKNLLNIDVSKYFQGLDVLRIYKCIDTGFCFYYPLKLEGDSEFYETLQAFPWYYMDWKWEFDITKTLLQSHDNVLEIGCGRGAFLEQLKQHNISCVGLEFNKKAVEFAQSKGLKVLNQSIEEYAAETKEFHDLICSFQVLEHVSEIKKFLDATITSLKVGGRLVISVPNNDSYLKYPSQTEIYWIMNSPPHHIGLWNKSSLQYIQTIFPQLELERIVLEPCGPYEWHYKLYVQQLVNLFDNNEILKKFIWKVSKILFPPSLVVMKGLNKLKLINGHSILAIYKKLK